MGTFFIDNLEELWYDYFIIIIVVCLLSNFSLLSWWVKWGWAKGG